MWFRIGCPALLLVALGISRSGGEKVIIDTNTTIADASIEGAEVVDGGAPPTVVNIVTGAWIANDVKGCGSSRIYMSDGYVGGNLLGSDTSVLNLSDGYVAGHFNGNRSSTLNMSGGHVDSALAAQDSCTANVRGGYVERLLRGTQSGTLNLSGGQMNRIEVTDDSTLNMSGGEAASILVRDFGAANIFGGSVTGRVVVDYESVAAISGGLIGELLGTDRSTVSISTASIGLLTADQLTKVSVSDASIERDVLASGVSTLAMSGASIAQYLVAEETARVILSDSELGSYLLADDSSSVVCSGGSIGGHVTSTGSAVITCSGTTVEGPLLVDEFGVIDAGNVVLEEHVRVRQSAKLTLRAATVANYLLAVDLGTVDLFNVSIGGELQTSNNCEVHVSGTVGTLAANASLGGTLCLAPGGVLNANLGFYAGGDSTYTCQLDGPDNGLIAVAGKAVLSGDSTVTAEALGNLGAIGRSTRTIVTATSIAGTFGHAPAADDHLGHGVFCRGLSYTEATVNIDLFQAAAGDVDGDGELSIADLDLIRAAESFQRPGDWDWAEGDFDADGDVDNRDLQLILATGQFGTGPYATVAAMGSQGQLAIAPEPAAWILLAAYAFTVFLPAAWHRGVAAHRPSKAANEMPAQPSVSLHSCGQAAGAIVAVTVD